MRNLVPLLLFVFLSACASKSVVRKDYSSPEATFNTWTYAARNLDLRVLLESYAQSARPAMEQELGKTTQEALEAMQKEARLTSFDIEKIVYEDNLAYLRVRRKLKKDEGIEILTMVKEGDAWKLLP